MFYQRCYWIEKAQIDQFKQNRSKKVSWTCLPQLQAWFKSTQWLSKFVTEFPNPPWSLGSPLERTSCLQSLPVCSSWAVGSQICAVTLLRATLSYLAKIFHPRMPSCWIDRNHLLYPPRDCTWPSLHKGTSCNCEQNKKVIIIIKRSPIHCTNLWKWKPLNGF